MAAREPPPGYPSTCGVGMCVHDVPKPVWNSQRQCWRFSVGRKGCGAASLEIDGNNCWHELISPLDQGSLMFMFA